MSNFSTSYSWHVKKLFLLAYPVTLGQLGHIMVGLSDTYMAGHLGGVYLAAATLAFSFFFPFLFLGLGISSGPSALIAKAQGEGNRSLIKSLFWQSLFMNIVTGLFIMALIFGCSFYMHKVNPDVLLVTRAKPFLYVMIWSVLPVMMFQSFRQFAEGLSSTRPAMYISFLGNGLNVFLNWTLATGSCGFPELGLLGIAWATVTARLIMALLMAWYVLRTPRLNQYLKGEFYIGMQWGAMKHLLKKSVPVGIQMSLESGVFSMGAIFISLLGTTAIASHQIALNLAAATYMAATGLSAAVAVRVGYEWGAGNKIQIYRAGVSAFVMVSVFMLSMSALFVLCRHYLPVLFISEQDIIETTASLLLTAALFQLADGVQVVGIGALRGIGDVVAPTFISILAYWAIGLPVGYWLTFHAGMGVQGIWYGFTIGLFIAALLMFVRFMLLAGRMKNR